MGGSADVWVFFVLFFSFSSTDILLTSPQLEEYFKRRGSTEESHRRNKQCIKTASQQVAVLWCGVVWCGVVWCGVVWCGVVWCGVVWCGVV